MLVGNYGNQSKQTNPVFYHHLSYCDGGSDSEFRHPTEGNGATDTRSETSNWRTETSSCRYKENYWIFQTKEVLSISSFIMNWKGPPEAWSASVSELLPRPAKTQAAWVRIQALTLSAPNSLKRPGVCCHVYGAHKRTCVDCRNMPNHHTSIVLCVEVCNVNCVSYRQRQEW